MIILNSTVRSLEILLAGAVTTNQLPFLAAYIDLVSTTDAYTPDSNHGQTNGTTAVTAVGAPAGSTTRHLKFLEIQNADTVAATVIVRYNDNGTTRVLQRTTLAVNESLFYTDGEGWRAIDVNGAVKQTSVSSAHALLSTSHSDATAGTVARGDVITGQGASATWTRLAVGAAARLLRSDGTDASWAQATLTTDVTGLLPIANGGTNSSTALNNSRIMVSSAGAIVELAAGTNGQLVVGQTAAAPLWQTITGDWTLTAGGVATVVSAAGNFTVAASAAVLQIGGGATAATLRFMEPSGSGTSYTEFRAGAQGGNVTYTWPAQDGVANYVLTTTGSGGLDWAQVVTSGIADNNVTDAKLRNSGALSVIGRSANSSGDPADIAAVAGGGGVLRESGSVIGFGTITVGAITGVLPIANGGTNSSTALNNSRIMVSSAGAIVEAGAMTNGQLLIGSTSAAPVVAALTAGTNITITNGAGSITIAAKPESYSATFGGRLTLTSGTAFTTSDVTAATTLYYALHIHDSISLYDGSWSQITFAEQSIKLTDTQTGTTTNTSTVITGLTDTSQFMRGMEVTGTGIAASSTISSIDSATQVTLNNAATASGTVSLTFKLPAGKNYDLFGVKVSSALKLRWSNSWTNDTTRADALGTQNGVRVNNAAINSTDSNTIAAKQGVYLGTIRTTATAGQTEDSAQYRLVWNYYNQGRKNGYVNVTGSHTYATAAWRYWNNNSAAASRVHIVLGLDSFNTFGIHADLERTAGTGTAGYIALGFDSATGDVPAVRNINAYIQFGTSLPAKLLTAGYHYVAATEYCDAGDTMQSSTVYLLGGLMV